MTISILAPGVRNSWADTAKYQQEAEDLRDMPLQLEQQYNVKIQELQADHFGKTAQATMQFNIAAAACSADALNHQQCEYVLYSSICFSPGGAHSDSM